MADPEQPLDVVCLGESMALLAPDPIQPLVEGSALRLSVAGAESNVAINLARLGGRVAWCGRVGADPFGAMIIDRFAETGVIVTGVEIDTRLPTGVYFKDPHGGTVYYYRSGSAASTMDATFMDRLPSAKVIHVSGITAALSPECTQGVKHLILDRPHEATISFDVNHRAKLWSAEFAGPVLRRLANASDLVFVGRDEAETLWGTTTPDQIRDHLDLAGTLVVKDGAVGATMYSGNRRYFAATPPVTIVEPVGAGDAFAAGFLYARTRRADPKAALRLGHLLAAAALRATGDIGEVPEQDRIDHVIAGH